jgi:2-oxoglutarate ferredoxin oxidoreductase subunit gamma
MMGEAMRSEIILSGSGGQGLILAGAILAEAAGIFEQKEVVQTQSYGIQARGGASQSTVIVSDSRIKFPEVYHPDILICLSQESFNRYSPDLKPGGLLIVDQDLVKIGPMDKEIRVVSLPFTAEAEKLTRRILANVIALGAMAVISGVVDCESIAKTLPNRLPERNVPLALKALEVGASLGEAQKAVRV